MIQLHRLEGFYWVARTGGFARAARSFPYPITQPAVHQQVKKLEAELKVELFERVGKDRMALTPAGTRLQEFVSPFFENLPGVVRSIREGDYGGELRIFTATLLLRSLMPAWIKRLLRAHPGVEVHLQESYAPPLDKLRSGEADLLVDFIPEVPDQVATMHVANMYPYIVLPRSHRHAKRKRVGLSDFEGEPFISYSPALLAHELQMRALAQHGVSPIRSLSAGTADGILGLVESGLGWSIVPSIDPRGPHSRGVVALTISAPRTAFPVVAAWRKDSPANPILDAALETAPRP